MEPETKIIIEEVKTLIMLSGLISLSWVASMIITTLLFGDTLLSVYIIACTIGVAAAFVILAIIKRILTFMRNI